MHIHFDIPTPKIFRSRSSSGKAQPAEPVRRDSIGYAVRTLGRFLAGQRKVFVLALFMLVIEAATAIFEEFPLAYLIDFLLGERPDIYTTLGLPVAISPTIVTIAVLTFAIVVMAMANSLCDSMAEIYLAKGGQMLGYDLRIALYKHLQRLSLAFHDRGRTGDILTRITSDVSEVEDFFTDSVSDIFGSLLVLIGTLSLLYYYSWQVALVAAIIVPIMAFVSNYFATRIKRAAKQQKAYQANLASASQEMLSSIRVIQTYSRGDYELQRFAVHNKQNVEAAYRLSVLQARFSWVVSVAQALSIAGVIWLGFWLLNYDAITVGTLVLFTRLIQKMFKPTRKLIREWNTIAKINASVERIGELLDRKPAVSDVADAMPAPPFRGRIQYQHVNFAYPTNAAELEDEETSSQGRGQVLSDLNFEVMPGGVMALVGHTGAGKSTIIQLLPRLYDPTAGRVLIDGLDIRDFTIESVRDQISVVLQESILFTGTIAENIAYGRQDATREEIVQAAIQANAHGFIEALPDGYDTVVSERGSNFSGGQRQRIAIARAFIRNTPILILDEPTTGLDAESAELVLLALRMLMRGKTTIIVSHDLKLVRHADNIVSLKDGRIEQMGTHRELLDVEGIYSNLYLKQYGEIKPEAEDVEDSLYDVLQSPEFRHRWPDVITAFDAEAMKVHLQNILFDDANSTYSIVSCKPGKASFLHNDGCLLRYALELEHATSKERQSSLVLARIFPESEEAADYVQQRLEPLAPRMEGRPEIAPFDHPVALLDELSMALSIFPIDGELPALIPATDRTAMKAYFQESLSQEDAPLAVEDLSIEAGHYGRQHRCVLRYDIEGSAVAGDPADMDMDGLNGNGAGAERPTDRQHQVVYGKVAADDRSKVVGAVLTQLQWRLKNVRTMRRFRIPRVVGYLPSIRLILLESIPGVPRVSEMLQALVAGESQSGPASLTLEDALQDCAHVGASLHEVDIHMENLRTFADEVASLEAQMPAVQQFSLGLAMQLEHALRRVQSYADRTAPMPFSFSHGDFTYTQLIFDEQSCGLVDFDTVGRAEPALDLGQFTAYLRLAERKAQRRAIEKGQPAVEVDVDALSALFLETYAQAAGYSGADLERLYARAAAYEIISLMRIALHSWKKLKSSRLEIAVELLEERISCLA